MPKTYTCAACGGVFVSEWSDADANAEAERLFGIAQASTRSDVAEICDDCHQEFMRWLRAKGLIDPDGAR